MGNGRAGELEGAPEKDRILAALLGADPSFAGRPVISIPLQLLPSKGYQPGFELVRQPDDDVDIAASSEIGAVLVGALEEDSRFERGQPSYAASAQRTDVWACSRPSRADDGSTGIVLIQV